MSSWVKVLLILLGITLMVLIGMCNKSIYNKQLVPYKDSLSVDTSKINSRALFKNY